MRPPLQLSPIPLPTMLRYASIGRCRSPQRHQASPPFSLPFSPLLTSQSMQTVSRPRTTHYTDLPRRYCWSYEFCPLPSSYFSAPRKRLLELSVDKSHGGWRGGFVQSKLEFGICNDDTSLSGVLVGFLVEL